MFLYEQLKFKPVDTFVMCYKIVRLRVFVGLAKALKEFVMNDSKVREKEEIKNEDLDRKIWKDMPNFEHPQEKQIWMHKQMHKQALQDAHVKKGST